MSLLVLSIKNCMHSAMISHVSSKVGLASATKVLVIPHCSRHAKHWNQKYRKERGAKVLKIDLPDHDEQRQNEKMSFEDFKAKLKEKRIQPTRPWNERPIQFTCTGDFIDVFSPPAEDSNLLLPAERKRIQQIKDYIGNRGKNYLALRKIRNFDYEFDVPTIAETVKDVYIEAQNALAAKDEDKLHELITEKAFPEIMEHVKNTTIKWKFIESLDPPRVMHLRCQEMNTKDDQYAQITVRLFTRQSLAIYDRFGRLMHGSEDAMKDVLEYVVFEKQITSDHGKWRIHGKIIPDWLPSRDAIVKTYVMPDVDAEFPEPPPESKPAVVEEDGEKKAAEIG